SHAFFFKANEGSANLHFDLVSGPCSAQVRHRYSLIPQQGCHVQASGPTKESRRRARGVCGASGGLDGWNERVVLTVPGLTAQGDARAQASGMEPPTLRPRK